MLRVTVEHEGETFEIEVGERQAFINGQHLTAGALFYRLDAAVQILVGLLTEGK
jgi:hypothetical protein